MHNPQAFQREMTAFQHVNSPQEVVKNLNIDFRGCFQHGSTSRIFLAYQAGPSLQEYFETVQPPKSPEEIRDFWSSLFRVIRPLVSYHHTILDSSENLLIDKDDMYVEPADKCIVAWIRVMVVKF